MAEKNDPPPDLVAALSNRLNDLAAQLARMDEERKSAPQGVARKDLDDAMAALKLELGEVEAAKAKAQQKKKEGEGEAEKSGEGSLATGLRSLSIFDE